MRRAMTHDGQFMPKLNAGGTAWQDQDWEAAAAAEISAKRSATLAGDSIMGYGDNTGAGGSTIGETSQSHVAWANSAMPGTALSIIANRGVGGTLIDGAAVSSLIGSGGSPQLPLAAVDNSDILWIHSGVNHLNPTIDASAPTVAKIVTKYRRLFDLAAPMKGLVFVDAITPLNAAALTPSGAAARRADIPLINSQIAALCASYRNVKFNDIYSPLAVDQAGNANPNYFTLLNGIHFTTWGAQVAGIVSAANLLKYLRPAAAYRVTKTILMMDFTGSAGTKTPGSGTINGNVATSLALTIAAGTGVVTASVADNKQRLVIDNSAGGATCTVQLNFSNTTAWNGTLANGDVVQSYTKIECASQTGMRRCNPTFIQNPAGTPVTVDGLSRSTQELVDSGAQGVALPLFPPSFSGIFPTRPFTLNAVIASINIAVTIEVAAGGSADVQISGYEINGQVAV
jgi:hypothetical protein